jgi:predicted membrane-bound mannosyltransferase
MGNGVIAFLIAISATVWIYSKFMRSSGSNTQRSIIAAAISGLAIFLVALFALGFIPKG